MKSYEPFKHLKHRHSIKTFVTWVVKLIESCFWGKTTFLGMYTVRFQLSMSSVTQLHCETHCVLAFRCAIRNAVPHGSRVCMLTEIYYSWSFQKPFIAVLHSPSGAKASRCFSRAKSTRSGQIRYTNSSDGKETVRWGGSKLCSNTKVKSPHISSKTQSDWMPHSEMTIDFRLTTI